MEEKEEKVEIEYKREGRDRVGEKEGGEREMEIK